MRGILLRAASAVGTALVAAAIAAHAAAITAAQTAPQDFTGRWTLNRALSEFPREIGFSPGFLPDASGGSLPSGGRGGRRSSGGGNAAAFPARPESEDDARRLQQLTTEVRDPPARLTIEDTPDAVTITDEHGVSRTLRPTGRPTILRIDDLPLEATARRENGELVVAYTVAEGRSISYSYSHAANPPRLTVNVQFVGRGGGDRVTRVYEPSTDAENVVSAQPPPAQPPPPLRTTVPAPSELATPAGQATGRADAPVVTARPGSELKGLTKLGIEVERLGPEASACGLTQEALETAVSKPLTDAGLNVLHNSDSDTYVYINVITTRMGPGACVSRYDAYLYSYTTATLSYGSVPILAQVSLFHKGGIAGGAPPAHGVEVVRNVSAYVDQIAMEIRAANK